jgi:hypothetical protein
MVFPKGWCGNESPELPQLLSRIHGRINPYEIALLTAITRASAFSFLKILLM